MNQETTVVEEQKKGFFSPFTSRDEALKGVKDLSNVFYVVAGIQGVVGYFVATSLIYDAVVFAVLATALRLWNSRVAGVLLLIMSTITLVTTVMSRMGVAELGGGNIFLALVVFWAGIKATEAAFKLHGRFADKKDDELSFNADAVRNEDQF